jgi:hypothetical protein
MRPPRAAHLWKPPDRDVDQGEPSSGSPFFGEESQLPPRSNRMRIVPQRKTLSLQRNLVLAALARELNALARRDWRVAAARPQYQSASAAG